MENLVRIPCALAMMLSSFALLCVITIAPGMAHAGENATATYQTHVQNEGWQGWKAEGATSGTSGKSLRLEGIRIKKEAAYSGSIEYRTHIQNVGWQGWKKDGALSGTTGRSLRLEAIQIRLTGELAKQYDVYYRVHAQLIGWMGWAKNGEKAGTAGFALRLEAIQIQLVKKGANTSKFTSAKKQAFWQLDAKKLISIAKTLPSPGAGLCAAWVELIHEAAGYGTINGNANELWKRYCFTSSKAKLKPGMIVAVQRSKPSGVGYRYGHVGLYIGNGKIMHNGSGKIKTTTLNAWLKEYNYSKNAAWGYIIPRA